MLGIKKSAGLLWEQIGNPSCTRRLQCIGGLALGVLGLLTLYCTVSAVMHPDFVACALHTNFPLSSHFGLIAAGICFAGFASCVASFLITAPTLGL